LNCVPRPSRAALGGTFTSRYGYDGQSWRIPTHRPLIMSKPLLTVAEILSWADAFRARRGRFPRQDDGPVFEADLTWGAVSQSLMRG
jgi:hypothetical protein